MYQPRGSNSTGMSSAGSTPNPRKERGAIAAQACELCRSRKQKCDEARPKCGLCNRMKLDCKYREPQPTKKDRTLVEILERLRSIEEKVGSIGSPQPYSYGSGGPGESSSSSQPSFPAQSTANVSSSTSHLSSHQFWNPSLGSIDLNKSQPYRHASAAHKMLTWPAVQRILAHAQPSDDYDISRLVSEGSAFMLSLPSTKLPLDQILSERPFLGMQMQDSRTRGGARVTYPTLTLEVMTKLAEAYFDTFNIIYPFMHRQTFMSEIIPKVNSEGFDGDSISVLALLVFALGELALAGTTGPPIHTYKGRSSGLRGGTAERPPGLGLFNAARAKLGFVMTECTLENVQIFSLAALFFQACSCHVEFWRLTESASMACQVLITCNEIDWNTERGDLTKRVYWHCAIMETGLHLELELPMANLISLEDIVPLPSFNGTFCEADHWADAITNYQSHWASQIAMRRFCANIHQNINESMGQATMAGSNEDFNGPTASTLRTLASQLSQWRSMLPWALRWPEDDPCANPVHDEQSVLSLGRTPWPGFQLQQPGQSQQPFFTTDLQAETPHYPYVFSMQVALLRTRYLYAKYMIYRPFIYKALHFPDQMTQEDIEGVGECLKACLKWPILTSPPSRQKRLAPYLFCWSQNFLGILIIFYMTKHLPVLRQVRQRLSSLNPQFETDVNETVELMLDWIEDLKVCDPIAQWCSKTLGSIYDLDRR